MFLTPQLADMRFLKAFTVIVLFHGIHGAVISHAISTQSMEGAAAYVGIGYDLLLGNPDGVSLTSGKFTIMR